MTTISSRLGWTFLLIALTSLLGCEGSGSDVGPQFQPENVRQLIGAVRDALDGKPIDGAGMVFGEDRGASNSTGRFRVGFANAGTRTLVVEGAIASSSAGTTSYLSLAYPVDFDGGRRSAGRTVFLVDRSQSAELTLPIGVPLPVGTTLQDPRTGSRLVLDGVTLEFVDPTTRPGETEVTVRFGVLDPWRIPLPVEDVLGFVQQNGPVALIEPLDLLLTDGRVVLSDPLALPDGAGGVDAYGLPAESAGWEDSGVATVQGSEVDLGAIVTRAGMYTYARDCPAGAATTNVSGKVVDAEGEAIKDAIVTVWGWTTTTDVDGAFLLEDVCAIDGMGAPLDLFVHVETSIDRRAVAISTTVTPAPGLPTTVPPLRMVAPPVSDVRVLVVYRGFPSPGRFARVGNEASGSFLGVTNAAGQYLAFDVSTGSRVGASAAFFEEGNDRKIFRDIRDFTFNETGVVRERKLFIDDNRFKARKLSGEATLRCVVRGSAGPLEDAFGLSGLDGTKSGKRRFSSNNGVARISGAGKAPGTLTAVKQTELPASDGVHDVSRQVSYRAYYGVNSRRLSMDLAVAADPGDPRALPPYGGVGGAVMGATDPAAMPPSNAGYEIRMVAHRSANRRELAASWLGLDPQIPLLRQDLPILRPVADFIDPTYAVTLDSGLTRVVAVEVDADAMGSGTIVQTGLSLPTGVPAGVVSPADVVLEAVNPTSLQLFTVGLDADLSSVMPTSSFAWSESESLAYLGGPLPDLMFDTGTGRIDVSFPSPPMGTMAQNVLFLEWESNGAAESLAQRAVDVEPMNGANVELLRVPRLTTPAPGGNLDPFMTGIVFDADPRAQLTTIRLTRQDTIVEGSQNVLVNYEYVIDVAAGVDTIVFPIIPPEIGSREVPEFFLPGTYDVEILAWNWVGELIDYDRRAAYLEQIFEWQTDPRVSSCYKTTVVIP